MKLFNKFVSIVTVVAFVLSMMAVPAFAAVAAGVEGYQTLTGNEAITVTYYSDSACENPITTAEPGATVYAKFSVNVPTKTISNVSGAFKVANATVEAETNADLFSAAIGSHFEKSAVGNKIEADKSGMSFSVSKKTSGEHNSPTDLFTNMGFIMMNYATMQYTAIDVDKFDVNVYELKVSETENDVVKMTMNQGMIGIGAIDPAFEAANMYSFVLDSPVSFSDAGLTVKSAAADVITTAYDATIANTPVDPELDQSAKEAAIKDLIAVTKVTTTNGSADAGVDVKDACSFSFDHAAKTVTVTFPADEKNTGATSETLNYTEMVITYGTPAVDLEYPLYDYAVTEDAIAEDVSVTVLKTKDGAVEKLTLVAGTDYDVVVTFATDANTGKAVVTFKGAYAGNTAVTKTFTRTDAPVSYKDLVASISGSPFAFGTTEDQIKIAIAVKGTKVEGVVETADVKVPVDAYTVTVDMTAKTATVAMNDGTEVANAELTFEISEETFTYSNYAVEYTGEAAYDYTTTENIAGKVKVTATKTSNENPDNTETVDLTNEVEITVDKENDVITIAWVDGSAHAGAYTFQDIPVTFNDVIKYKNASASLSKTSFASDATDDEIKGFLTVSIEEFVNDVKNDNFVADYNVTVDRANNKVIVEFADEYGVEDIEIGGITFLATGTVTLKVEAATNVTEGVVDISGAGADTEFTAVVKVEGLDTRVMTGADLAISASEGELKSVAVVAGSNYNIPEGAIASNVWTGKINKVDGAANLANGLLVVTVDAAGVADGTDIAINVDSATLYMVDVANNDFATIPNIAEALEVTVKAFERNVEDVTVDAFDIGIITLGPVIDAKFVNGVSLAAEDGTEVDLTDKVTLNSTARKIQVAELTLPVSATKDEVKYTLKVEVAGYTTIEEEIVVSYNGEATNDWTVTNPITANSAIYAGNVNSINAIEADDYITIVQAYGEAAAYDIYEGGATIDLNDIMTTVYMIDTYGMQNVTAAGIIE